MMEYIKKLRLCIRWFQELEGNYVVEQDKLRTLLDSAEKKCSDMGILYILFYSFLVLLTELGLVIISYFCVLVIEMLMMGKEEELNSIIMELRKNYTSLQEKFVKEESDKLV